MKNILLIVFLLGAGYQGYNYYIKHMNMAPVYEEPYVAVYGRDSCSITRNMLSDLRNAGIDYKYFVVDRDDVKEFLVARMKGQGLETRRYNLPVVDVNGALDVRPKSQDVINKFSRSL